MRGPGRADKEGKSKRQGGGPGSKHTGPYGLAMWGQDIDGHSRLCPKYEKIDGEEFKSYVVSHQRLRFVSKFEIILSFSLCHVWKVATFYGAAWQGKK